MTSSEPDKPQKAFLKPEVGANLPCMFNPETLTISRTNSWTSTPSQSEIFTEQFYGGGEATSMTLNLLFDTTSDGSAVTKYTDAVLKLMDPDPDLPGSDESSNNVRPPTVTFHWGEIATNPSVVKTVEVKFTYFSNTGTPLRAEVTLTMTEFISDLIQEPQNPTSGTPEPHRVHRVQRGETLDRIAARYYGESTRWRDLAVLNQIEDPLALRPGSLLSIPRRVNP
jgi:LysM repeat protein